MIIRKLSLSLLAVAALAPVVVSASPEAIALNACAKAFASSLAGTSAPLYKVNYDQNAGVNTVAGFYVRNYSFTLQAQDKKTGASLATATCSADTRGEVLELTSAVTSKVAAKATLASR